MESLSTLKSVREVKHGGLEISAVPTNFACSSIGSCLLVCALDQKTKISGVAHFTLPKTTPGSRLESSSHFIDPGLSGFIAALVAKGADITTTKFLPVGAAQIFRFSAQTRNQLDLGTRNLLAFKEYVLDNRLEIVEGDVGGTIGRSVIFHSETGVVRVTSAASGEKTITSLGAKK